MKMRRIIDHIGIVVKDLDNAVQWYSVILGHPPELWREMPEVGLRAAVFQAANIRVELICYTERRGIAEGVMGSEPGLNHIALATDDFEAETKRLNRAGFLTQSGFPRSGVYGRVTFFERDPVTGTLLELCESSGVESH